MWQCGCGVLDRREPSGDVAAEVFCFEEVFGKEVIGAGDERVAQGLSLFHTKLDLQYCQSILLPWGPKALVLGQIRPPKEVGSQDTLAGCRVFSFEQAESSSRVLDRQAEGQGWQLVRVR